jgi:DNA polymerase III delta' subunit
MTVDATINVGLRTRGHPVALAAARAIVESGATHALLIAGPGGVGKTTLALDLAAVLLCTGATGPARPCRACRGCRMVVSGNHPDLHRLAPDGPGGQIRIGERSNADPGTVRRLVSDLSLLPVEGGARVAIVEGAHRMNDDAQSALLKTLEEPGAGITIILCADEEERLLPTIRSRCARIRLGTLDVREIEAILGEQAAADAPTAARLGRLAGGRPGIALAYARAPEAVLARTEIARSLLDLLGASRARRLAGARELLASAAMVAGGLADAGAPRAGDGDAPAGRARRGRRAVAPPARSVAPSGSPAFSADQGGEVETEPAESGRRAPAAERRRAAGQLIEIWREVARDLAVVRLGQPGQVRDIALLDELAAAAEGLDEAAAPRFLVRLARAGELLDVNVGPELLVDDLVIAWRPRGAAA